MMSSFEVERGHKPRNVGNLQNGKGKEMDSARNSSEANPVLPTPEFLVQ